MWERAGTAGRRQSVRDLRRQVIAPRNAAAAAHYLARIAELERAMAAP